VIGALGKNQNSESAWTEYCRSAKQIVETRMVMVFILLFAVMENIGFECYLKVSKEQPKF
jgi:hypothetical protein